MIVTAVNESKSIIEILQLSNSAELSNPHLIYNKINYLFIIKINKYNNILRRSRILFSFPFTCVI